ncbi:serine hydrolase domain-containing protein [Streptomyces sp. NBC_00827]|uniref:serine hydrolase domain-containing protein n=1 Tax=Streptomyces sp. NBC_00827 TaxID=2903677 RepID=UPI00387079ED|nr:beta-lactamase family protein [Streptomyces sp. NBC_00827]
MSRDDVGARMRARVGAVLERLVESGQENGLQVAVYLDGELIVDACAGDASPGRAVAPDTLIHSFSLGKGFTATLVHILADRGLVDYDTPIAHYWPEFGAHGKDRATVRHALTHATGVPQLPAAITPAELCDWDTMSAIVAAQEPLWEPGTASGYHGWTFGWILGETVRRITGLTPAEALRTYVAEPLGVADELFYGLPESELPRTAPLVEGDWAAYLESLPPSVPFVRLVAPNRSVWTTAELANRRDYLLADLPAGGTTTARAAARMYAALLGEVDGVRLLTPERTRLASAVAVDGKDRTFLGRSTKGLGYFLGLPEMAGETTSFGHHGSGGSIAFADRERGLSFALTRTRLVSPEVDTGRVLANEVRSLVSQPDSHAL